MIFLPLKEALVNAFKGCHGVACDISAESLFIDCASKFIVENLERLRHVFGTPNLGHFCERIL